MVEQNLIKASDPRQVDFNAIFAKDLPDEQVLEDYSCALQERIMAHGRIYVTKNFICFYSNLFGVTTVVTPLKNVIGIYKRNTAIVFPNAIEVVLLTDGKEQKLFFTSFLFRDQAYQSIVTQWEILRQTTQSQDINDTIIAPNSSKSSDSTASNSNALELKDISNSSASSSPSSSRNLTDSEDDSNEEEQEEDEIEDVLSSQQSPETRSSSSIDTTAKTTTTATTTVATQKEKKRFEHRSFDDNESSIREERRNSIATVVGGNNVDNSNNISSSKQKYRNRSASTSDLGTPNLTPSSSIKDNLSNLITSSTEELNNSNASVENSNNEVTTTTTTTTSKEDFLTPIISSACNHSEEYEEVVSITDTIEGEVLDIFSILLSDKSMFQMKVHETVSYSENNISKWNATSCCIQRELTFVSPITARLGPKSTKVTQIQNCRLLSKDHLVLDIKSYSKDVPYGDAFIVLVRIHLTKDSSASNNKPTSTIKVSFNVKWLKSIWGPKGLIEKSCIDGMKDYYAKWLPMAKSTMSSSSLSPSEDVKSSKKHKSSRKSSSSSSKSKEKKKSKDRHSKNTSELPKETEVLKNMEKEQSEPINSSDNKTSNSILSNSMMQYLFILQSIVVIFVLLPLVISNNSRLYYSEQQNNLYQQHIRNLDTKVTLLRNYIELSNSNDPNDVPILKDYLNSWKSNPSLLLQDTITKLHSQLELVQSELDHSVKFVNNLRGLEWENSDISSLSSQSYLSFLYPWIPTTVLIVVMYILYKKYK